LHDYFDNAWRQ